MLSPAEVAISVSNSSKHKALMPTLSIIYLSIMAGGSIAMGDIFWAHSTVGVANIAPGLSNFIGGIAFSVGLMMVVFFGGHLFTSSVLTGVSAYEHKLNIGQTAFYWIVVWVFNFVGSITIAYMYYHSGLPLNYGGEILKHFVELAANKTSLGFDQAFIRAIFCNVFVCMAVWSAAAAQDLAGKVFVIMFMIGAFVACGYEHCVANMFIITLGLIGKAHYLAEVGDVAALSNMLHHFSVAKLSNLGIDSFLIKNMIPVTLGNIVGGLFFVGIIGFISHAPDMKKNK